VLELIFAGGGFLLGLLVGRWWALAAAPLTGLFIGLWEKVEIPGWLYGLLAGGLVAIGIALGVALRAPRRARPQV
jgi:hypothetical protein